MVSEALARTQRLLGVHPVRIMDDVFNCAHDYLCDGLDCLERSLGEALPDLPRERAHELVDQLHERLKTRLDRNLDKMELYVLSNVFSVPEGIDPDLQQHQQQETNGQVAFNRQQLPFPQKR
jgi:hypothetical protein